jgi:soluble lytic murein transglycosylase-like protein
MRMTTAFRFRRAFVAALILTAILTAFPVAQASAATTKGTRYTYVSKKVCPIDWRQGTYYVKQLIRCAARHYGVSVTKALAIARRESRFNPKAYNSSSSAEGLYQHLRRYWPGRAYAYGFKGWSAFNGRANAIVTMRMVKRHGWGPWGG